VTARQLQGIRVQVPLVIEMTPQQVAEYALDNGLPRAGGPLRAREVVADVQAYVLAAVQEASAFAGATVSIKGGRA